VIDSHCHLDRVDDLQACLATNLKAMVTIGTNVERSRAAIALAESDARVFAVVGIHPTEASKALEPEVPPTLLDLAQHDRVVALGETGFDDHWKDETLDTQRQAFDIHVELARAVDKPLVLHVRDQQGSEEASRAAEYAIRETPDIVGVLHCFGGDPGLLEVGLASGWYVSFAGNLTFPSADRIREAASRVPVDRLLVETDAPFLTPVPHRGKRNQPAYVQHTAAFLAELRGVPLLELEQQLDSNAKAFYRLPVDVP